jgi:nucleoside-diphosphate-sugar epimerase
MTSASAVLHVLREERVTAIVHAAGLVGDCRTPASAFEPVNLGGTRTVLEAAQQLGISSFVYTSSGAWHGLPLPPSYWPCAFRGASPVHAQPQAMRWQASLS